MNRMNLTKTDDTESQREEWETIVREQVKKLRFGVVQITIHDGRVTQLAATEKTRIPSDGVVTH